MTRHDPATALFVGFVITITPTTTMASTVDDAVINTFGEATAEQHTPPEGNRLDIERFPTTYKMEVQGGVPELGVYRLVETRPVIEVNFDDETIQFYCEVVLEKSSRELEEFDDDHLRDTRAIILTPYLDHIEAIPFEELAQTIPCPAEINYQQE